VLGKEAGWRGGVFKAEKAKRNRKEIKFLQ
jgi:hypothetical protein